MAKKRRGLGCPGTEDCGCGCSSLGAGPGGPGRGPGSGPGGGVVPGPVTRRECVPAAACPELPPGVPNTIQMKRWWAGVHERYKKSMGLSGLGARPLSPISWGRPVDTNFDTTQAVRLPNRRWHHPRGYRTLKDTFAGLGGLGCCRPLSSGDYRCDTETTSYSTATPDQELCSSGLADSGQTLVAEPLLDPVNTDPYAEPAQLADSFEYKSTVQQAFMSDAVPEVQAVAGDVLMSVIQAQDLVAASQGDATAAMKLAAQQGGYASVRDFMSADPMTAQAIQSQAEGAHPKVQREQLLFGAALAVVLYGMWSSRKR